MNSKTKCLEFDCRESNRLLVKPAGGGGKASSLPPHKVVKEVVECRVAGHFSTLRKWGIVENEVTDEGVEDSSGCLPLRVRRRYAKAKNGFEVGIWSAGDVGLLLGIMVGSMAGVRNSYVELREDNRELRRQLALMGLDYADCFCGELSPESHEFRKRDGTVGITVGELWHLHGLMRFKEFIGAPDLHGIISPLWGKIHGSSVVDVKVQYNFDKTIKYAVKDAVKNYCSDDSQGRRLLMSKDWLPPGCRKVEKVLTAWALYHGAKWRPDDDLDIFEENYPSQYVAFSWEIRKDFLRRWCQGESITLDFGNYTLFITGSDIIRKELSLCG